MKLTAFSPAAGCGCKISSAVLQEILAKQPHHTTPFFPQLLVGNDTLDDAAVYDLETGMSVISTTDFFTPIVDNPFDFGRIAATNAISDIYAMGGKPIMAIAILGFPVDKLPTSVASEIIAGAKAICHQCNIPLAGGHSIQNADPIFGLAVTGIIPTANIKRNSTPKPNDILCLTKPLGIGLVTTAGKFDSATGTDIKTAIEWMTQPNKFGEILSTFEEVTAMTDVTGFGLLGHLSEMILPQKLTAVIDFKAIPTFGNLSQYIEQGSIPGGTERNYQGALHHVTSLTLHQKAILCDPQTSGGLLFAVNPSGLENVKAAAEKSNTPLYIIGRITEKAETAIVVE